MVADALVSWIVDDIHGDELCAEWEDVEVSLDGFVLFENLGQNHAGFPPCFDLEDGRVVAGGDRR